MLFGYNAYNLNGIYEKRIYDADWKPMNKEYWIKDHVAYIVTDPIPKVTLEEHIKENGPLNKSEMKLLMSVIIKSIVGCQSFGL